MSIDSLSANMSAMHLSDITSEEYWINLPGYQKITDIALSRLTDGTYIIGPTNFPAYKVIFYGVTGGAVKSDMIEICQSGSLYLLKVWMFGNGRGVKFYSTVPEMLQQHFSFLTHPLSP